MAELLGPQHDILHFWFGRVEETIVPTEHRARIWFGEDEATDLEIRKRFSDNLNAAMMGNYDLWTQTPRGQLALIITLDQFSRHIFRGLPSAFAQDEKALLICQQGLLHESDHALSLIERVFYYFPLLHAENSISQEQSLNAYSELVNLAFSETRVIFDSFFKFASHHYAIIQRFGRFPQRNKVLNRHSSEAELRYLKEMSER